MSIRLQPGILIAIEGIDGAGKTTQASALQARLEAVGLEVVRTKEPTAGPWGQKLRDSAQEGRLSPEQELDTFIRDRREHVDQLINPALEKGQVVIVDRYYFSTAAYQGARGLDVDEILEANAFAPTPDLLLLLEVDPSVGINRIRERGDEANLFEREEDLRRSAEIFAEMTFPFLLRMNGHLPADEVTDRALRWLHHGPLHDRLCARRQRGEACEPGGCMLGLGGGCDYPRVGDLALIDGGALVSRINALAADKNLTPEARIGATADLVKGTGGG